MEVKRHYKREFRNDAWYHDRDKYHNVISFSGPGRAGKTTLSKMLASEGYGIYVTLYTLRDYFERKVYHALERSPDQRNIDVFGVGTLGWMLAEFHWRVKDYLNEGQTIICDHFFFDYHVEMMPESESIDSLHLFLRSTAAPRVDRGCHFYLDIDFETYLKRSDREGITELNTIPEQIFEERRERYLKLCKTEKLIYIDAMTTIEETYNAIKVVLDD